MANLPSTVALPQPLIETAAHHHAFERRRATAAPRGPCHKLTIALTQAEWRKVASLKSHYRINLCGLVRSLLLGMPLPAPLVRRSPPAKVEVATARMLMLLRSSLVQAVHLVGREQAAWGTTDLRSRQASALLEQQLSELLPLLDGLARLLLDGWDHE